MRKTLFTYITYLVFLTTLFSSCLAHKDLISFRSGEKDQKPILPTLPKQEIAVPPILVQVNDILSIVISAADPQFAIPFNFTPPQFAANISPTSPQSSHLVNLNGEINLPVLGTFQVKGKTTSAIREEVLERAAKYVKDPSANVRIMNFKVNIMGEVERPATIIVDNEQITILEALSKVGDFTPYANREEVMVVREQNGERTFGKVNLKSTEVFSSPYYYLRQNDIIYIEPLKTKLGKLDQPINRYLTPVQVAISVIGVTASIITTIAILQRNQ
jgi:polysaccharide biosynthesis/export protein